MLLWRGGCDAISFTTEASVSALDVSATDLGSLRVGQRTKHQTAGHNDYQEESSEELTHRFPFLTSGM